jgi:hypothetical protein
VQVVCEASSGFFTFTMMLKSPRMYLAAIGEEEEEKKHKKLNGSRGE